MFGRLNQNSGYIILGQKQSAYEQQNKNLKSPFVSILDDNLKFLPRLFTITTNSGSYKFNIDLLKDTSKTISKQLEKNSNNLEYHLDINDSKNTMKKMEEIYCGLVKAFDFDELAPIRQIIKLLDIDNCPIYFKPDINKNFYSIPSQIDIEIEKNSLQSFLKSNNQNTFTIKTNKNQYQCSALGVLSSKVIYDIKMTNPEMNEYIYNFDDDNNEFENIIQLFNFESIQMTVDNMDSLKQIAEELEIEPIINSINEFVSTYENSVKLIDDKKVIIETIDEIFHLLHNIQMLTVESVKKSIIHSIWVKTEENVQELVACILQTARVGYKLQPYLIELVISLHESSNDNNKLSTLLPYLANFLKFTFSKTPFYSSFYLKMAQKGLVDMEEALNEATKIATYKCIESRQCEYWNNDIVNVLTWFLPELFERNENNEDFLTIQIDQKNATFLKKFIPSNIDEYRKMRDSGMPLDPISIAICKDDVDTLQSIITKNGIDINDAKVPPSIFDVFEYGQQLYTYINYSAMHGSVKCFKYLLLNHAEFDDLTFVLSIYGGNTEIIRLVDQNSPRIMRSQTSRQGFFNNNNQYQFYNFGKNLNNNYYNNANRSIHSYDSRYLSVLLSPAIMNHQNDLFDWIFENKYDEIKQMSILDIAFIAVQNGNVHALIQCIDKGLDIHSNNNNFLLSIVIEACHDGFYRILQLIISLCDDNFTSFNIQLDQIIYSGNESIFNLLKSKFVRIKNSINPYSVIFPLEHNYNKIANQILEDISLQFLNINVFKAVIQNKNMVIFNFLKEKYTFNRIFNAYMSINNNNNLNVFDVLNESCEAGFFEAVKELTEFILSNNSLADFTSSFFTAISSNQKEIYNYFLDKKVRILIKQADQNLSAFTQIDNDLCIKLFDKIDPNSKDEVLKEIFNFAVLKGNENLVNLLINESRLNCLSLINAVQSSNLNIVNMILNIKSDTNFINMAQKSGTALNIAVKNNKIDIVKRLLSIPKINTLMYDCDDCTPFMNAICNFNVEMIDVFVQFYGDQISSQIWQINKGIQNILKLLSKSDQNLKKKKKVHAENEYDDDDDGDSDQESCVKKVSLFDRKIVFKQKRSELFNTISKLAQFEGVDLNCYFSSNTLLSYACEVNDLELFDFLLKSNKVDVNTYSPLTGNTPLIVAILNDSIQISQILIEYNQTDINHRNYLNQTALTIAASKENKSIIQSLINNEKFDSEISSIYDAYFKSSVNEINQILLNVKDFDINVRMIIDKYIDLFVNNNSSNNDEDDDNNNNININQYFQNENFSNYLRIPFITPLIKAILDQQEEMIDKIVSHPTFNKEKSSYIDATFASVYMNNINIFRKLISMFGDDVNLINNEGKSLLWFSIYMTTNSITTEILNHDSFDSEKSQIVSAFIKAGFFVLADMSGYYKSPKARFHNINSNFGTPQFGVPNNLNNINNGGHMLGFNYNQALINQMNELLDFDENHEKLIKINEYLPSGKTFFTSINPYLQNIAAVVNILIARGADPNLPDMNGVYPIIYACQANNSNFTQALMHVNNIDLSNRTSGYYNRGSKGDTVLHILISQNDANLFYETLNNNLDLINLENENGDTPLLIACKQEKFIFIMILFSKDELDYKHRNKEGSDALDILKKAVKIYNNGKCRNNYGYNWGVPQFNVIKPDDIQSEEKREYYKKIVAFFHD